MIKSFGKILGYCLAIISTGQAEPSTPKDGEPRADGMVNIGGVLYSEEEMKDPEKRRKAELAIERILQLKEASASPRNYSDISTPELFKTVLESTRNVRFKDDLNELSKRPLETRVAIDGFLNNEKPFDGDLLFFSVLPSVAEVLGAEYHVQVVKRILDHPLAQKYDEVLLEDKTSSMVGGGLLNHLAASGKDETGTLDKLIAEGRIERGSELELKWRKRLSGGERKEKDRPEKNDPQDARAGDRVPGGIPMGKADSEASSDRTYLVLGGLFVVLGILALVFKLLKAGSTR